MTAFYNEIDPYAAQWIRNLITAGHIAPGVVDERSIEDITPDELRGFTQCHFFAGVAVWSLALRFAGWPDNRPIWTGSCPCQPFSTAGQGAGFADERHLWPAFHHLIAECRPAIVFGEQVASKDADPWVELVHADLEAVDYAFGAVAFASASVGAPHPRERTYWVAHADHGGFEIGNEERPWPGAAVPSSEIGRVAHTGMPEPNAGRAPGGQQSIRDEHGQLGKSDGAGPVNGWWRDADWIGCTDGFWRPVESGAFPLADGIANRMGKLRAYGNAVNAQQAQIFIECASGSVRPAVDDLSDLI